MNSKLLKYLEKRPAPTVSGRDLISVPVIVGDSKVRYLEDAFVTSQAECKSAMPIQFYSRSGYGVADLYDWLVAFLPERFGNYRKKVTLYIWIGTCDLTEKKPGGIINLRNPSTDDVKSYMDGQFQRLLSLVDKFPRMIEGICLLECPCFSIRMYNEYKGANPDNYKEQDALLDDQVFEVNEVIRRLSYECDDIAPPKLNEILHHSRKPKGQSATPYTNFGLYLDGIHPKPLLARAWMRKIEYAVCNRCYSQ